MGSSKFMVGLFLLSMLPFAGCGGDQTVDEQISSTVNDTHTIRDAQAAASDLIRNASDCDAVKAAYQDVKTKLDEAARQVQTQAGRTSLETLRRQVAPIAEACGVR